MNFPRLGATLTKLLAGGVVAGASTFFFPVNAQAAACSDTFVPWNEVFTVAGYSCTLGDKEYSNFITNITDTPLVPPALFITFSENGLEYDLNTISLPGISVPVASEGPPTLFNFFYGYDMRITNPAYEFDSFAVDTSGNRGIANAGNYGARKSIDYFDGVFTASGFNPGGVPSGYDVTLTSLNGGQDSVFPVPGGVTYVRILDEIGTNGPGTLDQVSNNAVQRPIAPVPGPLAIAGASVAFGYSRRIRGRIKLTKTLS